LPLTALEDCLMFYSNLHCNRVPHGHIVKSKAIPVKGRGGLYSCKMLRIPHCLDNQVIGGGKVVSHTLLQRNIIFLMFPVLISVRG
jgi:hypothetical protein